MMTLPFQLYPLRNSNISVVQQLEKKVEQLSSDLDLLAYVMSHNTLNPIRDMEAIMQKLLTHGEFDEPVTALLQSAQQQVAAMFALNNAVLEFIRIGNTTLKWKEVDGNEILATTLEELETSIASTKATITYDKVPQLTLHGRERHFIRLFTHLLDNAIKFHSSAPPVIHISITQEGDFWKFTIKDNGIGIEEELLGIIFVLFQRAPGAEAIPGMGVGLAVAKKTVEYFGGEICMESELGKGSTVIFTLPVN